MWFTGLKVHVIATSQEQPQEFAISAGSAHDLAAFQKMYLETLPQGSTIFGDKAYTSAPFEQELLASKDILLAEERKSNSKRGQSLIYVRYGKKMRKKIETSFGGIVRWLPRRIHAVTNHGVILKLMLLVTAFSMSFLCF